MVNCFILVKNISSLDKYSFAEILKTFYGKNLNKLKDRRACFEFSAFYNNLKKEAGQGDSEAGITENGFLGFLDYRVIDEIAKKIIYDRENISDYNASLFTKISPNITANRYRLRNVIDQNNIYFFCNMDFRGAESSTSRYSNLELEKDLQCLRIAHDILYLPCKNQLGKVISFMITDKEFPGEVLNDLINPDLNMFERINRYNNLIKKLYPDS